MQKISFFVLLSALLIISACKEPQLPTIEKRERVYLHIINMYKPVPSLDIDFEAFEQKQAAVSNLQTYKAWPQSGYASILSIHKPDSANNIFGGLYFTIKNHFTGDNILPKTIYDLQTVVPNTFAVIDVQGTPTVIRAADSFDSLDYRSCGVRFMDLSNSLASMTLMSTDTVIEHKNMSYLGYTPFKKFPAGTYNMKIVDAQNIVNTVYSFGEVSLQPGRNYAFYISDDGSGGITGFYERIDK